MKLPKFCRDNIDVAYMHKSLSHGYQNVSHAENFAKAVTYMLSLKYPAENLQNVAVNIFAGDTSSMFLAVFVKILFPSWKIVVFNKKEAGNGFKIHPNNSKFDLYIDDYFYAGQSTRSLFRTMKDYGYKPRTVHLFYMDSGKLPEEIIFLSGNHNLYPAPVVTAGVWAFESDKLYGTSEQNT